MKTINILFKTCRIFNYIKLSTNDQNCNLCKEDTIVEAK